MDAFPWCPSESRSGDEVPGSSIIDSESRQVIFDSGSFRDRTSRVFLSNGEVFRTLNGEACAVWRKVSSQPFFRDMTAAGEIVATVEIHPNDAKQFSTPAAVVGILKHERVPFISYPYEWSFSMLREAALLHLRILSKAIRTDLILKDASPFNVQFRGCQPAFIDIGSFQELVPGEPWSAYRQFCEMMLFPLLLQAYRNVHFQPILRSQLEGIPARQFLQWLRWRDLLRPGVFTNGWLQAALERRTQALTSSTVRDLKNSGFHSSIIEQMLTNLTRLLERLAWVPEQTQWANYNESLPHVADDARRKGEFVRSVCQTRHRDLIWDLGCNDGRYSMIACEYATTVVAMDQDHGCIDRLYQHARINHPNILPLCVELANSSPALGWRGRERKRLEDRGQPDLVIFLGLIHHLVFAANIPLADVVNWLASLGGELVLEFPSKNDAMVQALLRNKKDQYEEYSLENLERELCKHFEICVRESLPSGERTLFHAIPKVRSDGAL
jgi:hypothetical protein